MYFKEINTIINLMHFLIFAKYQSISVFPLNSLESHYNQKVVNTFELVTYKHMSTFYIAFTLGTIRFFLF